MANDSRPRKEARALGDPSTGELLEEVWRRLARALGKEVAEQLRGAGTPIVKASPDGEESPEVAAIRAEARRKLGLGDVKGLRFGGYSGVHVLRAK